MFFHNLLDEIAVAMHTKENLDRNNYSYAGRHFYKLILLVAVETLFWSIFQFSSKIRYFQH